MLITVGTYDGNLYGWDLVTTAKGQELRLSVATDAHIGSVRTMRMVRTSRGLRLITGGQDEALNVFDMEARKQSGSLIRHTGAINEVAFFASKNMLSCSDDGTVGVWRTSDWECLHVLGGHKGPVRSVCVHPSGRVALSVGEDGTLRMWDLVQGRVGYIKRLATAAEWVRFSPDGLHFAVGEGNTVYVHRVQDAEVSGVCEGKARLSCVEFVSPDILVTGGTDCNLTFWSIEGDELAMVPTGLTSRIRALCVVNEDGVGVQRGGETEEPAAAGEEARASTVVSRGGPGEEGDAVEQVAKAKSVVVACISSSGQLQLWDATQIVYPPATEGEEEADVAVEIIAETTVPNDQRPLCISCTPTSSAAFNPADAARAMIEAHEGVHVAGTDATDGGRSTHRSDATRQGEAGRTHGGQKAGKGKGKGAGKKEDKDARKRQRKINPATASLKRIKSAQKAKMLVKENNAREAAAHLG